MDLKEKLASVTWLSGKKYVSPLLILALALVGAGLLAVAAWLAVADWRAARAEVAAAAEAEAAVAQILEPVQSIERVLSDEQVQALAARAIDNPATTEDLFAYVNGRMSQVTAVQVFPASIAEARPDQLAANGYALFDMVLAALDGNPSLLQIHHGLQPPALLDAVPVRSGEETVGVLVVTMEPAFLLAAFQPRFDELDYIRLSQYNGSQPASTLGEAGDPSRLGEVPERLAIAGTLFRIEMPRQNIVGLLSGSTLVTMVLVGLLSLVVALVLHRGNRRWALERQIEEAQRKRLQSADDAERAELARATEGGVAALPAAAKVSAERAGVRSEPAAGGQQPARVEPGAAPALRLKYNIPQRRRLQESDHPPLELRPEIFRAYDIRGVINETLDSGVARSVGQAVGTLALEKNAGPVVVARDGRLSGPYLMEGMIDGILASGCDVLDIGAVPTGVLYFAAHELAAGSGVVITGSHNPPDYNGFKIMVAGDTLYGDGIKDIYLRITEGRLAEGEGDMTQRNVVPDYIEKIASDIQIERPLKVVIDCGNGIGGVCAADTLRAIGAEVLPLFDEVDGTFPNHHPDPSDPENLKDLIESVRLMDADLGLALDGDADRLGVVTLAGNIIYPDRVMMLLAMDVLDRVPGATIIYDVKCTGHLPQVIREAGGVPMMYKTGHSLIKAKMKEIGSPFAGEMSGHFFFKERWYGVDDGIYSAARLLEILGSTDTPPEAILNALPSSYSTPELKVQMQEGENHAFIEQFKSAAHFDGAQISTIDGLRADFSDGWGLVRASNTTPILVVRFDAETEEALGRIKATFRSQMLALKPDLELPF
ncbi:MAG: phosphomannomutase/phosphoglucomutase [Lysobacterales bacterium]